MCTGKESGHKEVKFLDLEGTELGFDLEISFNACVLSTSLQYLLVRARACCPPTQEVGHQSLLFCNPSVSAVDHLYYIL